MNRCNEGELLYPGDNEGDWVCDCKPGFLHSPQFGTRNVSCFEAWTYGPCSTKELYVLNNSSVPECILNECQVGQVYYQDGCYPLNAEDACIKFKEFIGRKVLLTVDSTTLKLTCSDEANRYNCKNNCCIGSKRYIDNVCEDKPQSNNTVKQATH